MQLKPMPFDFVVLCICLHRQAPRVIELDGIESERERMEERKSARFRGVDNNNCARDLCLRRGFWIVTCLE